MDETIVFRQIWYSHYDDEPDRYFFLKGELYFYVDIFLRIACEKEENANKYTYLYNIVDVVSRKSNRISEELQDTLNTLKEVILEWNINTLGSTRPQDTFFAKVMYKGEE